MTGRRDSKNRILHNGEYQRQDGKYEYRYTDSDGKIRSVSSWRLVVSDKTPAGKRVTTPLRDLEVEIEKDLSDEAQPKAEKYTLNDMFDQYMNFQEGTTSTSKVNSIRNYNKHFRNNIGKRDITTIRFSDVVRTYDRIVRQGLSVSSLGAMRGCINQVFEMAINDGIISTNPANGAYAVIKKRYPNRRPKKCAMTMEEQESLLKFISSSNKYRRYVPLVIFLLGTGCRIGEATGLTWDDCDFDNNEISINHALQYVPTKVHGGFRYLIAPTKTRAGTRMIPMLPEVRELLLREKEYQRQHGGVTAVIDGKSGFVFRNRDGGVVSPREFSMVLHRIVEAHNKAADEGKPGAPTIHLPVISAHTMRHTFCTRLCEQDVNVKVIQSVMGHTNISITMDVYTDVSEQRKRLSFENLGGKLGIGDNITFPEQRR